MPENKKDDYTDSLLELLYYYTKAIKSKHYWAASYLCGNIISISKTVWLDKKLAELIRYLKRETDSIRNGFSDSDEECLMTAREVVDRLIQ